MAICADCRAKVDDGAVRCIGCGKSLSSPGSFVQVSGFVLIALASIPLGIGVVSEARRKDPLRIGLPGEERTRDEGVRQPLGSTAPTRLSDTPAQQLAQLAVDLAALGLGGVTLVV